MCACIHSHTCLWSESAHFDSFKLPDVNIYSIYCVRQNQSDKFNIHKTRACIYDQRAEEERSGGCRNRSGMVEGWM